MSTNWPSMQGMAQRMGSSSTRRVCSGKGGELECLLGGWVGAPLSAHLHDFI